MREYHGNNFIDESLIRSLLQSGATAARQRVLEIIKLSAEAKGLSPEEAAILIQVEESELLEMMYHTARQIKEKIYGKRIVFFAPLYISNFCINNCAYCGYHTANHTMARRRLNDDEIRKEVGILLSMGHKRIALELGEDPVQNPIDYVLQALNTIYSVRDARGNAIRRINVNIAATTIEEYQLLKAAGIGTYILFQETYHQSTYEQLHPHGPKSDYLYHLTAMDRAMLGGIDDVGAGVLYGLYDYRFEVVATLLHALHLEERFGVGPHTISVPRLRPAQDVNLADFPCLVSDNDFRKIIAVLRLAVPYTGMLLSTREPAGYRDELIALGISQISAGSCTGVGGYREEQDSGTDSTAQFQIEDTRSPEQLVASLCVGGYLPSWCTACYRQGRTGDRFMALAKKGQIQNVCQPNALLTFKEYLMDFASPATRQTGERLIADSLQAITSEKMKAATIERLRQIENGQRDLYF